MAAEMMNVSLEDRIKSRTPDVPREDNSLSEQEQSDLKLALGMANQMLFKEETQAMLMKGLQSADPSMVLGQFVGMMMLHMKKGFEEKKMPVSDRIWMSEGGFVHQIVDDIDAVTTANGTDLDDNIKESLFMEVAEVMKGLSKSGQGQPQQPGPPQPGGAPMPPQGGPGPMPGAPPMGGMQ